MALYRPQGSEVDVLSVADGCYRHTKGLQGQLSVEAERFGLLCSEVGQRFTTDSLRNNY